MRKFKVEIPIILITIIILSMLALSGKQVYQSLSEIVNSMLAETRPDHRLMLAKDISADLNGLENAVKLYSLSEDRRYLKSFSELTNSIEIKLSEFQHYSVKDSLSLHTRDSLLMFANQKMAIWQNVLNLYLSKEDEHEAFSEYADKLDTLLIATDTFFYPEAEKVGFLKRVFGKKKEAPEPVIIDRTQEKQSLQDEISKLENEIASRNKQISSQEAAYMRKSQEISAYLARIISRLELHEQQSLLTKTQDADQLASATYKRLAWLALTVFLLMALVLFLFFRDLRKSRNYQKALSKAKTEAEALARTKAVFAATVSHEMRTPVSAIYGLSEQLLQQEHEEKTKKNLEIIHKSTKHLIDLVNDTFDFTRIENQHLQLQALHYYLNDLVEEIVVLNQSNATNKGIELHVKKDFEEGLVLFNDESRLKQILNNLIGNAIKFTDRGSVELSVSTPKNERLLFQVTDTGVGIPKEKQELIFEDFVQLDTDINKKAGGTGLGLYLVKKLVLLLKGEIKLESTPGVGTTFTVTLPLVKGNPEKVEKTFKSLPAPKALIGAKILIVDDEEFNRHLLKNILSKWKIDFDEAENGRQAIEKAEKFPYPLILMDVRMPVLSGTEATRQLKASHNPAKIIGLSANTKQREIIEYRKTGFDNYLIKPFTEAALHETITKTFEKENSDNTLINNTIEKPELDADLSDLLKMANGDHDFVREMIEIFQRSSADSLAAMNKSIETESWQELADIAHKLAAPAKHLNAREVYSLLKSIQSLAEKNANPKDIIHSFHILKDKLKDLNTVLANFKSKL